MREVIARELSLHGAHGRPARDYLGLLALVAPAAYPGITVVGPFR